MAEPLHQLNVTYVAAEDRLLLRASTRSGDEYRLWLTRRYSGLLTAILQKQMEKFGGAPVLAASDAAKDQFRQGAMEKKYEADHGLNFPLGEAGILAVKINSRIGEDGVMQLQLLPASGEGVTLQLNRTLLYMFYTLLAQGVDQAEWHLSASPSDARVH